MWNKRKILIQPFNSRQWVRRIGCKMFSTATWRPHPEGEAAAFLFSFLK
jgi:hypothetical protein